MHIIAISYFMCILQYVYNNLRYFIYGRLYTLKLCCTAMHFFIVEFWRNLLQIWKSFVTELLYLVLLGLQEYIFVVHSQVLLAMTVLYHCLESKVFSTNYFSNLSFTHLNYVDMFSVGVIHILHWLSLWKVALNYVMLKLCLYV